MRRLTLAVVLLAASSGAAARSSQQTYVTVVSGDTPVTGLQSADIVLRDGGVRQAVLSVESATDPTAIAVVLDSLDAADLPDVGRAVGAAARILGTANADNRLGLMTLEGSSQRVRIVSPPAADAPTPIDAATGTLRNAVVDSTANAAAALSQARTDRRHVLLIIRRRAGDDVEEPDRLTEALLRAKASLWTIEIGAGGRKLDDVLIGASTMGGALRRKVADPAAVPAAVAHVLDLLSAQYVVTYTWPDPMLSQLSFTTRHDRGDVLAPIWAR